MNEMPWRLHEAHPGKHYGVHPTVGTPGLGRYSRAPQDYIDRFYSLFRMWESETAALSSLTDIFDHPAFLGIVAMGETVVPLIIGELRRNNSSFVSFAAEQITGVRPYGDEARGKIKAINEAWLLWADRTGY